MKCFSHNYYYLTNIIHIIFKANHQLRSQTTTANFFSYFYLTTGRHWVQRGPIGQEGIGKDPSGAGGQQDQGEDQQVHAAEAEQGEQPGAWGNVHHIVPVRRQVHGEERGKIDSEGRQVRDGLHRRIHSTQRFDFFMNVFRFVFMS